MNKTIKLYYENEYAYGFEARVLCALPLTDGSCELVLDRTAFFPEEGGQSCDRGTLNGWEVTHVRIAENVIYHKVTAPAGTFAEGAAVSGSVDGAHRFSNMQQHTGEHIFSGLAHKLYGCTNVGFHLSDQIVTLDLDKPLTEAQIRNIEEQANRVITANVPVTVLYPSASELSSLDYRSKLDLTEDVRIVVIEGTDMCACCAPHVRRTGEVGMLKVQHVQNYKGGVRVSILCGERALCDYRTRVSQAEEISELLSAPQNELTEAVRKLKDERDALNYKTIELQKKLLSVLIRTVPESAENALICIEEADANAARNAVNTLMETRPGICCVLIGDDERGYRFIIGSRTVDARNVLSRLKETLGAKGGGSPAMVQGSVQASETEIKEKILP
ncbi:MAG: hypothetical protein IJL97_05725 [Lachnospiraceae bacterium]|nr:hypothetical protein [Lachnospiraceae bacterium]